VVKFIFFNRWIREVNPEFRPRKFKDLKGKEEEKNQEQEIEFKMPEQTNE
jgi:hypothetical protein